VRPVLATAYGSGSPSRDDPESGTSLRLAHGPPAGASLCQDSAVPGRPNRYGWYALAVMTAIAFLNYLDRYILPAAAPLIQKEFTLSDGQLGALASAFLVFYALCALPFGFWADRGIRKNVIAAGVAIWSVATLLTGAAQGFLQLLGARALLGVGEAGYFPAGTSLLADYFPKEVRARASALWNAGTVVGIATGFIGGGIVAQALGWRWAFYGTAVPGLICAGLAATMREPRRGQAEPEGPALAPARHAQDATFATFVGLLRIRSYRAVVIAQIIVFAVLAALATWLPTYIHRRFGLGVAASATYGGGLLIGGGLIGTLVGGWVGDWRARKDPRAYLQIATLSFAVGAVLLYLAFQAATLTVFVPFALATATVLYLYTGPFTALQQNVVIPTLRASAVTLGLFAAHLLGDSWSSWFAGVLSDQLRDLRIALILFTPPLLLLAAIATATGIGSTRRDIENMENAWAERARAAA
jgi:predicted MFS family arabinose efflux permease